MATIIYCNHSASEVSHVACRPQTAFTPNAQIMSDSKQVHEGNNTKGTLAKGHLCAYPIQDRLGRSRGDGRSPIACMISTLNIISFPQIKTTQVITIVIQLNKSQW